MAETWMTAHGRVQHSMDSPVKIRKDPYEPTASLIRRLTKIVVGRRRRNGLRDQKLLTFWALEKNEAIRKTL